MKFKAELEFKGLPNNFQKINYRTQSIWLGSCFTEHIGLRLQQLKFQTEVNNFGTLFNPISIADNITRAIHKTNLLPQNVLQQNNEWISLKHPTTFNQPTEALLHATIKKADDDFLESLAKSDYIFITYGTAWVYTLKNTTNVVGNCHKLPADNFDKTLLDLNNAIENQQKLFDLIFSVNPKIKIVITISPVRHLRDGMVENNQSKGLLHLMVKALCEKQECCIYFPAYEWVVDELRDYRFFERDFAHPNQLAVDFVWEKFTESFISVEAAQIMKKVDSLNKLFEHKPKNTLSTDYQKFISTIENKLTDLDTIGLNTKTEHEKLLRLKTKTYSD